VSSGGDSDVSSGLSELEGKLRELERAFSALGPEVDGHPPVTPDTPVTPLAVAPPAPERRDDVQQQIDELVRSHERLTATVQALVEDVSLIADELAVEAPAAPARAPVASVQAPASVWEPAPAAYSEPTAADLTAVHVAAPLIPHGEPTPVPVARSVRDYLPTPPSSRPPAAATADDDGG
jgi:hypothetical protein